MAILLAIAMIFTMVDPSIFGGTISVQAEEPARQGWNDDKTIYYIGSSENLKHVADNYTSNNSEGTALRSAAYEVTDDILLGDWAENGVNIGTKDYPFTNTFNGNGHRIYNLVYNDLIATNGGLFSHVKGATIKNLIIDGAEIRSNQYGGILASRAEDATIQNVTIINSKCKIASLGNVVGLITTGGLYGGALVGYASNTKIYNCESRNTDVYVDTTGGVQALGGDGMYMGGLVGWMDNGSIIEYSRVVGGEVSTQYYVAVGALAANLLYAGGIVGRLDGSDGATTKILDCFSTANVNYSGECYVSVGAGLNGYAGGIAARVSGSNYAMERCHFAGNLSGHLLNSILVLPIIAMEDYYLGGIAGQVENSNNIHNCYFNWENAIVGNSYPGGPNVPAVWGQSNDPNMSAIGDAQYSDSTFFVNFDFDGTTERITGNAVPFNEGHINKWVINRNTNMPVHGNIVYAEMNFPSAGTIKFWETSIQDATETDGSTIGTIQQIAQTYAEMNEEIKLSATVKEGYVFEGWYLKGTEQQIESTVETIDDVGYYSVRLGGDSADTYKYKDGDVFEARYKANVTFMKYDKETLQETVPYSYEEPLKFITAETPGDEYLFLGWTESKNWSKTDKEYDEDTLQSSDLSDITFVEEDEIIRGPRTLYPVFIRVENYNVKVQLQTADPIDETNPYIKKEAGDEGTASITTDENGELCLTVIPNDGISEDTGYRFDGWYELELNEDGSVKLDNTTGQPIMTLVSKKLNFSLKNVDLLKQHRYEARYQYRVDAYIPIKYWVTPAVPRLHYGESVDGSLFGTFYIGYKGKIDAIPKPSFNEATFGFWSSEISPLNDGDGYSQSQMENLFGDETLKNKEIIVTEPISIYAIIELHSVELSDYNPVLAKSDFPIGILNSEITSEEIPWSLNFDIRTDFTRDSNYNFSGIWRYERNSDNTWAMNSIENLDLTQSTLSHEFRITSTDIEDLREKLVFARLTANVTFNYQSDIKTEPVTVKRKYNSKIFNLDNGSTQNWDSPDWRVEESDTTNKLLESPDYTTPGAIPVGEGDTLDESVAYRKGYQFIGWTTESTDNKTLYNADEEFVTTNINVAEASVLDEETARVTEAMTLNPVYVPYNISFDTSFGIPEEGDTTRPAIPTGEVSDDGILTITLDSSDASNGYDFQNWIVTRNGVEISFESLKGEDGKLRIDPIAKYEFTAVYEAEVSFKNAEKDVDGNLGDKTESYEYGENIIGDKITELPVSQLSVNNDEYNISMSDTMDFGDAKVFVGWEGLPYNDEAPENEYKFCESLNGILFINEDSKVEKAVNLWPIYTKPQITLESNINSKFEDSEVKPSVIISEEGSVTLSAPGVPGYEFAGWEDEEGNFPFVDEEGNPIKENNYTLSPEDLREEHTYTACYNPIITYYSPVVDENDNISYTPGSITVEYGSKFSEVEDKLDKGNLNDGYTFEGWTTTKNGTEKVDPQTSITEGMELYPIISENGKRIFTLTVYSNMDDSVYEIKVEDNAGEISLPSEAELESVGLKPIKDEDKDVSTQFVGYSLVAINEDGTRNSTAMYTNKNSVSKEMSPEVLIEYSGADTNKRIYAVWTQIQNISKASIYQNEDKSQIGLFTAAAVNTTILANAGLQSNGECGYDRHILYSKDSKYTIATTNRTSWNNTLYQQYFDKDFVPDGNWNIYVSFLYNISSPVDQYGVCPYLSFTYKNSTVGNFRDENNQTVEHTLKGVAQELLSLQEAEQEEYSWSSYKEIIEGYANYEEAN